jgi:2-polyprenyl-3-methyl-5-hydroxy-6-metoxy-1,4-benzoquinol methylase
MDLIEYKQVKGKFQRHPWERVRLSIAAYFIRKEFKKAKQIIDIGSGDAYIARGLAKKYGSTQFIAVDSNYNKEVLSTFNDKDVSNITYQTSLPGSEDQELFEGVILMDVLEHIEKPGALLTQLKNEIISKDATIFITVPAFQDLFTQHDTDLGHFKRYNRKQLIQLVEAAGFKVSTCGYFFFSLYVVRMLQKLSGKGIKASTLYNWKGGPFITGAIKNLFYVEFKFSYYLSQLGIHLPGLTCYCICKPLPS